MRVATSDRYASDGTREAVLSAAPFRVAVPYFRRRTSRSASRLQSRRDGPAPRSKTVWFRRTAYVVPLFCVVASAPVCTKIVQRFFVRSLTVPHGLVHGPSTRVPSRKLAAVQVSPAPGDVRRHLCPAPRVRRYGGPSHERWARRRDTTASSSGGGASAGPSDLAQANSSRRARATETRPSSFPAAASLSSRPTARLRTRSHRCSKEGGAATGTVVVAVAGAVAMASRTSERSTLGGTLLRCICVRKLQKRAGPGAPNVLVACSALVPPWAPPSPPVMCSIYFSVPRYGPKILRTW